MLSSLVLRVVRDCRIVVAGNPRGSEPSPIEQSWYRAGALGLESLRFHAGLFKQFNLTAGKLVVRFIEFEETNDPTIVTAKLVLAKAEWVPFFWDHEF